MVEGKTSFQIQCFFSLSSTAFVRFLIFTTMILSLMPVHSSESTSSSNENNDHGESTRILAACRIVKKKISSASQLFYPSDPGYNETIKHFILSSTTYSACSVEPGTAEDVSIILKIIDEYRVPFAVKGGGHIFNPGFSSTIGIHISMRRFNKVVYYSDDKAVDVGPGLVWDEVYAALDPLNINVVGGRLSGIGVAGLSLGGGYSWKTNQYGLAVDNIFEYQLVAPDGRIVNVNKNSYPDIFFGLKGAHNNFGIVTNFKFRAVPQTLVYGGFLVYDSSEAHLILQAIVNFNARNKDPRAQIMAFPTISLGQLSVLLVVFYDAPTTPNGIFDEFLVIPHASSLETRSFLSFMQATPTALLAHPRARFSSIAVSNVTTRLINGLMSEYLYRNSTLGSKRGTFITTGVIPFLSSYLDKSTPGAFPHVASSNPTYPLGIIFGWDLASDDAVFLKEIEEMAAALVQIAIDDGQDVGGSKQILCPNYALSDTPLSQLYGKNVPRLQQIRKAWDPKNVMYLAGGFKL